MSSAFHSSNPESVDMKFPEAFRESDKAFYQSSVTKPWYKKKKVIILIGLLTLAVIVGIVFIVYFLTKESSTKSSKSMPLRTKVLEMESDMKKSEDPCADFYEYSCGRYIDKYLPIRNISSSVYIDRFTSLRENNTRRAKVIIEGMGNTKDPFFRKAYTYYSACINSKRSMDAYFRAADDIGGSDITTIGPFSYTSWDLETALKKMKVQYNANPLFTIHVGHDLFNASRNILLISPPDFNSLSQLATESNEPPRTHRRDGENSEYDFNFIAKLARSFGAQVTVPFLRDCDTRTGNPFAPSLRRIVEARKVEYAVLTDLKATFGGSSIQEIYKIVTVNELYNITEHRISWSSLLQSLSPVGLSFNINNDTEVGLMVPFSYLEKVKTYVSNTTRRELPNYFAWFLMKKFSPVLPDDYFARYYFDIRARDLGSKGKERWRACLLETEKTIPFSIGMMFAKDVVTPLAANKSSEMLAEIKSAFNRGMKLLTWLDQATKNAIEDKIKGMLRTIAGPHLFKTGWLSNLYKDVTVVGRNYPQIFESAQRNMVQINLKSYFRRVKRDEFDYGREVPNFYNPNAFYSRSRNLMTILSGILKPPLLFEDGPSYINFAKVGAILGYELLHGFDSNGWYFDKLGQISLWATKYFQNGFKTRAECVKNQYSAYRSGSNYVNGSKTLAENIADNAGLKYAYSAYKSFVARHHLNDAKPVGLEDFSHDQLFFVAYAQMWCRAASTTVKDKLALTDTRSPSKYRVIGSVSNFIPFANAFKCGPGTPMNPARKCEVW